MRAKLEALREEFAADLLAFIEAGNHKRPEKGGRVRLMTLHELNVAFGRSLDRSCPDGTAARLLRVLSPELHSQMQALAPFGVLLAGVWS